MDKLKEKLVEEITLKEMQLEVDRYIEQFKSGYFPPMTQMVRLTEEMGELAREINHLYGEKQKKESEELKKIEEEIADVLIVLLILTNSLEIDLSEAFLESMKKFYQRDSHRFERKSNT